LPSLPKHQAALYFENAQGSLMRNPSTMQVHHRMEGGYLPGTCKDVKLMIQPFSWQTLNIEELED
jgi:hypothetical protein